MDLGGGARTRPPGVQILSFSFSFQQIIRKNNRFLGVGAPFWGKSWIRHCIVDHSIKFIKKEESIPVGCTPPAWTDRTCVNSLGMSAFMRDLQVNKFEQVPSLGHQMALAGVGGRCTMRPDV